MSCPSCGWPTAEAEVVSRHCTSEGTVRYLRCVCGQVTIQLEGSTTGSLALVAAQEPCIWS